MKKLKIRPAILRVRGKDERHLAFVSKDTRAGSVVKYLQPSRKGNYYPYTEATFLYFPELDHHDQADLEESDEARKLEKRFDGMSFFQASDPMINNGEELEYFQTLPEGAELGSEIVQHCQHAEALGHPPNVKTITHIHGSVDAGYAEIGNLL